MNTKRTTKSKANARLLALLTTLAMVFSVMSLTAFAKGEMLVKVDTEGESGYPIEITETSASIPLKIYAGNDGGEFDHFDASVVNGKVQFRANNDYETVTPLCEIVGNCEDGYCYVNITSDELTPGTAYYIYLQRNDDSLPPFIPQPSYSTGDYSWKLYNTDNLYAYTFVTEGDGTRMTSWSGKQIEDPERNPTYPHVVALTNILYYTDGRLQVVATSPEGETMDYTKSGGSPWTAEYNSYYITVQTLDIRAGVRNIGDYSFSPLINLKSVTNSDGVSDLTSIGEYAFKGCVSLRDFDLYSNAEDIDIAPTAFDGCSDVTIHVKPDQLAAYQAKFPNLANVTFAGDLTPDVEPTAPELVSSEGKDIIAKTYTDLELQNAPGEGYEYKFIVYNETTNQWYKLQDFSDATTFRWYTGPAGVKNLYVDIRNKSDETDVKRVELTGVNVTDSGLAATLAIEPTGELAAKTQATLTATAENGTAPYEYKFIVFNATTNQWYKLKDFGPESTFDWYTGPAGTKTLYVDVKDANGVVVRQPLENIVVK